MVDSAMLAKEIAGLGAFKVGIVSTGEVPFDRAFRTACEVNYCGLYGKCWTCPPHVGDIDELIAKAKSYKEAVVYQSVHTIEDSFDIEGMIEAGGNHNQLSQKISVLLEKIPREDFIHLGAGGCRYCERCAKADEEPCRHPDKALASLEGYGIAVSQLAEVSGMKYINGQNTITYFGAVFLK